jgi:hypothetical protein
MTRYTISVVIASVLVSGAALAASGVVSQTAKDVEGAWTLVSADDLRPNGTRNPLFGSNPVGLLIFLPDGTYSLQIKDSGQAKFASGDRAKATPDECQATVLANNPHWGKYTVNEADRTITFQIEHAMFPNWEGTTQTRAFTLTGDQLKYTVPNATIAGANPELVWKRAK